MDFYTKFPPLKNVSVRTAHIVQWGAPVVSVIIFGFILWYFNGKAELFITIGLVKVHMAYMFSVLTIIQTIQAYRISQKMQKDAYITAYGSIVEGICTHIQHYPFAYIIVKFNERDVKRSLLWSESKKFNIKDIVQVRYNPDNDMEYVVYPYDTKNA